MNDPAQFVRWRDDGLREAWVQVLRTDCRDARMYFGPEAGPVQLKPVEMDSLGAQLYQDLCAD